MRRDCVAFNRFGLDFMTEWFVKIIVTASASGDFFNMFGICRKIIINRFSEQLLWGGKKRTMYKKAHPVYKYEECFHN